MQSLSARIFSLLSVLFFVIGVVLRIAVPLFNLSFGVNIAFYVCLSVGAVFIVLGSTKENNLSKAFDFENKNYLSWLSYLASVGFFVDFVHQAVIIYLLAQGNGYKSVPTLVSSCVACVMAIASCFYLFTIGMSYSDFGYDFRKLKLLHIAPILWAIANVLGVMSEAISPLKDVNTIVKYVALLVAVLYFYFLSKEVYNDDSANKITLMMARLFSYLSMLFFIDRAMLLVTNNAQLLDKNSVLGVSMLFISMFALVHQRSIKKGA